MTAIEQPALSQTVVLLDDEQSSHDAVLKALKVQILSKHDTICLHILNPTMKEVAACIQLLWLDGVPTLELNHIVNDSLATVADLTFVDGKWEWADEESMRALLPAMSRNKPAVADEAPATSSQLAAVIYFRHTVRQLMKIPLPKECLEAATSVNIALSRLEGVWPGIVDPQQQE